MPEKHPRLLKLRVRELHLSLGGLRGLHRSLKMCHRHRRNRTVVPLHARRDRGRVDVADNEKSRVRSCIVFFVKVIRLRHGETRDFRLGSDGRILIRMNRVGRIIKLVVGHGLRVIETHIQLADDSALFGLKKFRADREIRHSVAFELHHDRKSRLGKTLVVIRTIQPSRRILIGPAAFGQDFVELPVRMGGRPPKHHVLKEMREPRGIQLRVEFLIFGADTEPRLIREDRSGVIFDDVEVQTVREGVLSERKPIRQLDLPDGSQRSGI